MKGQWFGSLVGTSSGKVNMDIDELQDCFEGIAYVETSDPRAPDLFLEIKTTGKFNSYQMQINGLGFVHDGIVVGKERATELFPEVLLPDLVDLEWSIAGREIDVKWSTNVATNGEAKLRLNDGDKPSLRTAGSTTTWAGFKQFVSQIEGSKTIFRGQENRIWRLRTAFHREGRANVYRFANVDVPRLYRDLVGLSLHKFNLNDPVEYGAFVSMVQHHGYPTPLLDWTYSPYIAAYFAFNDTHRTKIAEEHFVRVHAFDKGKWLSDFPQFPSLKVHKPHFSIVEPLALNNPRMIPQQALASVTNVADIESYVQECEELTGNSYLQVFDIPITERGIVLRELRMMGITAGSLFPGLDGACRQVRAEMFDRY